MLDRSDFGRICLAFTAFVLLAFPGPRNAAADVLPHMPVREITIFKDGHALLLHAGRLPTDEAGQVRLSYLPAPVMGTFWPFCNDSGAKLSAVIAGQQPVSVERTALNTAELLAGNIGAEVLIEEAGGTCTFGTILDWPTRSSAELAATSPPDSGPSLAEKGDVILLSTPEGTRVVPVSQIQRVTFKNDCRTKHRSDELRNLLTLKLDWQDKQPAPSADVGMMYLQKGIRWIPSYRVTIDGAGSARVELQATLLNELTDLDDVTAHLVIGVPSFLFADTPDPIGLQSAVAQLSQHFRPGSQTAGALSNALMTQARMGETRGNAVSDAGPATPAGPELSDAERNEDLFVFTLQHVSLRRGERMVLPVASFGLPYQDVYTLDLPFAPPAELRAQLNLQAPPELARLLSAPKVYHSLRMTNKSAYPLTTAPALIMSAGKVLAQGMLTYAAKNSAVDLRVTAAVDLRVEKSDSEVQRVLNAVTWQNNAYGRVELTGQIALTNFRDKPVKVEIRRHVLGNVDQASHDARIETVNVFEDGSFLPADAGPDWPNYWRYWNWPYWWHHFNRVSRIRWDVMIDPGQRAELDYRWHYFWR